MIKVGTDLRWRRRRRRRRMINTRGVGRGYRNIVGDGVARESVI